MAGALRNLIGSVLTVTAANAVANNAYSVSGDKLTIDNTTNLALLADFHLNLTFGTAPVTGSIILIAVDWSLDATPVAGAAPVATLLGKYVGTFDRQPQASNTATTWIARLDSIPLTAKTDYYILNSGTGQAISTGWVLKAQCWSPG
jgi:hypothetical protein